MLLLISLSFDAEVTEGILVPWELPCSCSAAGGQHFSLSWVPRMPTKRRLSTCTGGAICAIC